MDKKVALAALAALAQETRLDVFRLLVHAGRKGMPSGEIGTRLDVRQNTMSANLSVLLAAGLVRRERQGRSVRYFANIDGIGALLVFLSRECCQGRVTLSGPGVEAFLDAASADLTAKPEPVS
ncbi:MAG: metalloregulator ArsR/SmtB family transcription factor [Pseudomonadota bacterium]